MSEVQNVSSIPEKEMVAVHVEGPTPDAPALGEETEYERFEEEGPANFGDPVR